MPLLKLFEMDMYRVVDSRYTYIVLQPRPPFAIFIFHSTFNLRNTDSTRRVAIRCLISYKSSSLLPMQHFFSSELHLTLYSVCYHRPSSNSSSSVHFKQFSFAEYFSSHLSDRTFSRLCSMLLFFKLHIQAILVNAFLILLSQ